MSEETETKFCRDCRFYAYHDCEHPDTRVPPKIDIVTGETLLSGISSARFERSKEGACGKLGLLFEPRLSIIDRIRAWWKS